MEIKNIICPQDFSNLSSKSLEYASIFARAIGAELILLHVIDTLKEDEITSIHGPTTESIHKNLMNQKLERLREEIENRYGIITRTRIEYGTVSDNIARIGNEPEMDLIVMGTSGAKSISEIFNAPETLKVIEKTHCPVLVVPEEADISEPKKWIFASALDDEFELLAHDIFSLSKLFNASLEVLNVTKKESEEEKVEIIDNNELANKITFTRIKNSNVLEGLNEYIESANPDLLVLVEHPHSKWDWLFKKDKISRIVEEANFPILILQGEKK